MRKLMISAAAAVVLAGSGAAFADDPICITCGSLPNSKWEWVVTGQTEEIKVSGLVYIRHGNHCKTVLAEEVTPGGITFGAQNPGGNIVASKGSVTEGGGDPEVTVLSNSNEGNVTDAACLALEEGQTLFVANPT